MFAEHLYFFFFWIASSFTAFFFFLIVFDRKRRLSPFLQAEIRLLHFLVYNGLFYYPSYPLFFCFYVWDFVGERSLPLYVSSVYAVHTLWKKKKKADGSAIWRYLVHMRCLCIFCDSSEGGMLRVVVHHTGAEARENAKKKKKKLLRTLFFLGFLLSPNRNKNKSNSNSKKNDDSLECRITVWGSFNSALRLCFSPTQFRRYTFFFPIWLMSHCYVLMICSTKRVYS